MSVRLLPRDAYNEQSILAYLKRENGLCATSVRVLKRSIDARQRTVLVYLTLRVYEGEQPEEQRCTPTHYPSVDDAPQAIGV